MNPRINEIATYISDSSLRTKYSLELRRSVTLVRLYDYSIITAWKIFILFIYEKIWQIPNDDVSKGLKSNSDLFKKFKPKSLLWPNEVDDDAILNVLDKFYESIDSNYIKRAKAIHHKRKVSAHVSEMTTDINSVDEFLKELIEIMKKIQECHKQYLDCIEIDNLSMVVQESKLSQQDLSYLIQKLIATLKDAGSFNAASSSLKSLLDMKTILTKSDVESILIAIQTNSKNEVYHQVLDASDSALLIKQLYEVHGEPSPAWQKFAIYVSTKLKSNTNRLRQFNWLFSIFGMQTYDEVNLVAEDEPINLDDIPF